jgi:quinolinate synthase
MIKYVKETDAEAYFMLTECGLTGRLQLELPEKQFVGSCTLCKYMKANTLEDVLRVLKRPLPDDVIELDESVRIKARHCIEQMFYYAEK